jgi:hypothetical protein
VSGELRFADEPLAASEEQTRRRRWRVAAAFERRSFGRMVVFMVLSLARREHLAEAKSPVEALGVRPPTNGCGFIGAAMPAGGGTKARSPLTEVAGRSAMVLRLVDPLGGPDCPYGCGVLM